MILRFFRPRRAAERAYAARQQAGMDHLLAVAREQKSARELDRQREASAPTEAFPVTPAPTIPLVQVIPTSPVIPAVPPQWSGRFPWLRRGQRAALPMGER